MKVIKKAKIVNICLNSPKQNQATTIHLSHDYSQDPFTNSINKQKQLVSDCYEAIRIIAGERSKGPDKKTMMMTSPEGFFQLKRTEKENDIKLPASIADSVQLILRRFLLAKAEQQQKGFRNSSSKLKQFNPKKPSKNPKALYFRKHKQNTEQSVQDKLDQDKCTSIFKMISPNVPTNNKLQSKINQLETRLGLYKQKIAEQNAAMAKMETREMLMRKKYQDEVTKIIRSKNIVNIQASYEKVMEDRSQSKGILGVSGRGMVTAGQNRKKEKEISKRSSQSSEEVNFKDTLIAKKKQLMKQSQGFRPYASSSNVFGSYLINNLHTLKEGAKQLGDHEDKEEKQSQVQQLTQNSKRLEELRLQEAALRQQRKQTIAQMSCVTADELQRNLQQLQQKLLQKMGQIQQQQLFQEQLFHGKGLNMKDEQFQSLEMNGFYQQSDLKLNSIPQS